MIERTRCRWSLGTLMFAWLVSVPAWGQSISPACANGRCPVPRPAAGVQSSIPSQWICSVVRVHHATDRGGSFGSASLVATQGNAHYFVTCAHLFDDGPGQTRLRLPGGTVLEAKLLAIDRPHDLVLLRSQATALRPMAVGEAPRSGELYACGYGPSGQMRVVRGPLVGYATPTGASSPSLRLRCTVRSGDSGGPLLDRSGRLVGVIWGERSGETFATFGAPLQRLLAKIPRPKRRTTPPVGDAPSVVVPAGPALSEAGPTPPWVERLEGKIESVAGESQTTLERLQESIRGIASGALQRANSAKRMFRVGEFLLGAATVGGPLGAAFLVSRWWWGKKHQRSVPARQQPIAVDTPPPPQQVVPETHYVAYEKDEYARAHQWASEQLVRKFPGSVELMTSLDSLIRQQLAGRAER